MNESVGPMANLIALCLFASVIPGAVQSTSDARSRVNVIIASVKPFDIASRDAAADELVAGGAVLIPAIREVMEKLPETRRANEATRNYPSPDATQTANETRLEALDIALVRLTWKGEPGRRVTEWMGNQIAGGPVRRIPSPVHIPSTVIESTLPDKLFYAVIVRQYPVSMMPPPPLAAQNVIVYQKDGSAKLFTKPADLQAFFIRSVGPAKNQGEGKKIAAAWLRLTQEFSQDGFFRFTVPDDQMKTAWQESGALIVTGKAVVVPKGGDSGEITATLTFIGQGNNPRRLISIAETRNVKAGIRPICQATKLLDADPIVRRMAEQDILVMGPAAWPYIAEQRAKASPELRKAIDRVWKRVLKMQR